MVFNTGPYTVLPDNSILITANMQSEMGFPSSHQLKSYVASKSRLKLAARAVLSAAAGLLVYLAFVTFKSFAIISDFDIAYCTLAASTPSVLSTVSGCYLTGVHTKQELSSS